MRITPGVAAFLLLPALLTPARAAGQIPESRVLATGIGAVAGVAGGGYVTLSVVVAESRRGHYVHDPKDLLGWRSLPVLGGAAIGGSLGFYSPERLEGAILYGAGGLGAGALLGLGVGSLVWKGREGKWAGAAIGAGIGLVLGNLYGVMNPPGALTTEDDLAAGAGVPLYIRIAF